MGKRETAADEAVNDLDRIFPGTRRAGLPDRRYIGERGPLVPPGEGVNREEERIPRARRRRG